MHVIWKYQTSYRMKVITLKSALGISTIANYISQLLDYISPLQVKYQG